MARSDPGKRRLADVGRHARPQHGLEHEGAADELGRQDEEERQVGRRAGLAGLRQSRSSPTASCSSAPTTRRCGIPNVKGDKGVLMAFRESDGQFLWQAVHDKLDRRPRQRLAVPGRLLVAARRERHRVLRVEPRRGDGGRHRRLPRQGENDGLVKDEKQTRETDADIIWRYDMMDELGVHPAQHGELVAGRATRT